MVFFSFFKGFMNGGNNNILPLTMRSFRINLSSCLHYFFLGENPKK